MHVFRYLPFAFFAYLDKYMQHRVGLSTVLVARVSELIWAYKRSTSSSVSSFETSKAHLVATLISCTHAHKISSMPCTHGRINSHMHVCMTVFIFWRSVVFFCVTRGECKRYLTCSCYARIRSQLASWTHRVPPSGCYCAAWAAEAEWAAALASYETLAAKWGRISMGGNTRGVVHDDNFEQCHIILHMHMHAIS